MKRTFEVYDAENDRVIQLKVKHWCLYCKDAIMEGEKYKSRKGNKYHLDCWKEMHTHAE